jgi:hypothetical protein
MNAGMKRFLKEFGGWMIVYAVMVPVSIWLLQRCETSRWRYLVAALPMIPLIFAMRATIRGIRGLDELYRRIHFEGVVFSFLATCLLTASWGFLQNAGLPRFDVIWVPPLLILLWGLGAGIASRRYR